MQNKLIDESIQQFMTLPGIGRKTAQRFVLHLLRKSLEDVTNFTETIQRMKENIRFCHVCNNISENDICEVCANHNRDHSTVIHSCNTVEQRLKVDKAFSAELNSIENSFKLKK